MIIGNEYSLLINDDSLGEPVDGVRRSLLKGFLTGGLALSVLGPVGTGKGRASSVFDDRAVYIWGYAPVLAIDAAARGQ